MVKIHSVALMMSITYHYSLWPHKEVSEIHLKVWQSCSAVMDGFLSVLLKYRHQFLISSISTRPRGSL
jgi:hypothetical protein